MNYSNEEIAILRNHGLNHPHLKNWINTANWEEIANWYTETGLAASPDGMEILMSWMSYDEMSKFYSCGYFQPWFAQFCAKLHSNEHIYPILGISSEQIGQKAHNTIAQVVKLRMAHNLLTVVVADLFRRNPLSLNDLLVCMTSDGIFSVQTTFYYFVEFQTYPRYLTLGLGSIPSALDCQSALLS